MPVLSRTLSALAAGALLGAVFRNAYSNDRQIEDDYSNGRRPLGERRVALEARITAGERNGSISRTGAARFREELRDLSRRWTDLETRVAMSR